MWNTGTRLSPLKLSLYLSLVCDGVVSSMLGLVVFQAVNHTMLDREIARTGTAVQAQVRDSNLTEVFRTAPAALGRGDLKTRLAPLQSLPEVIGVKVFDRQGTVLWADEARLIGRRVADNRELRQALRGKIGVEFKQTPQARDLYEWNRYAGLAAIYVPIVQPDGGSVIGVVQVYKYPVSLWDRIRQARQRMWAKSVSA